MDALFTCRLSSRRECYEKVTGHTVYAKSFCKTRWCENEEAAKTAAEIWEKYKGFIKHLKGLKKSQQPTCKSYLGLIGVVEDPLMVAKFKFVETVSWKLNEFLRGFQNDKPMLPFLSEELGSILRWCMGKFVLKDVLAKADKVPLLIKIDVDDSNLLKPDNLVDTGYAAKEELIRYKQQNPDKTSIILKFKKQAKIMLQKRCSHFMAKSPFKYAIVRLVVCFDPKFMVSYPDIAEKSFDHLVQKLLLLKKLPSTTFGDTSNMQFDKMMREIIPSENEKFLAFKKFDQRLDTFLVPYTVCSDYMAVFQVFQVICLLFHGQAAIERGFSVNKEHLADNLKEESLIALRFLDDYITSSEETPHRIKITNQLFSSCKGARGRYHLYLAEEKKKKQSGERDLKRKALQEELKEIASKKVKLLSSIDADTTRVEKLSIEAELNEDFSMLHMANSLRGVITKNKQKLTELEENEANLKKEKKL